eukprot:CAMPEP_0183763346 /NCGR_PEP_ID=MMETSP0739-20130205/9637_1 /TAXON_ID=385413 /ORGANISM="Thalassiosira miniscula, Strain CCMP1093" /LENGTH=718 /DNA_ID=CAMNT_0026001747 /DNA_START=150 /DNA_END=2306 /DNA_ORIENTATION=+
MSIIQRLIPLAFLCLCPEAASSAGTKAFSKANLRSGPCDESFPLAHPASQNRRGRREGHLVPIPPGVGASSKHYESGEYYAPLCSDGRHVDIRRLQRCNGGSCWNDDINQCTFECIWNPPTPKPTPPPSEEPTYQPTKPEKTDLPILISLEDLPLTYLMDEEVRKAIIDYLRVKLGSVFGSLPYELTLIELIDAGSLPGKPHSLPLDLAVSLPPFVGESVRLDILRVMRDSIPSFETDMKRNPSLGIEFDDVKVEVGVFDRNEIYNDISIESNEIYNDVSIESDPPTPTPSPTIDPEPINVMNTVVLEETTKVPWWVWLIVALVVLLCCLCCVCFYIRRRRKDGNDGKQEQNVNVFMQNPTPPRYFRRRQSSAESRTTRKPQHQPKSVSVRHSDRSRRSTRTKRTHKTRSSRPPPAPAAPASMVSIPMSVPVSAPIAETAVSDLALPDTAPDTMTFISALPAGFDPPPENALVLYNPQAQGRDPSYNPQQPLDRDPTFYTEYQVHPDQEEPEGDKVYRKQSMFGNASLMNEVRRERKDEVRKVRSTKAARVKKVHDKWDRNVQSEPNFASEPPEEGYGHSGQMSYHSDKILSEPEGVTSDELVSLPKNHAKKKKKKRRKMGSSSRHSRVNALRSSLKSSYKTIEEELLDQLSVDSDSIRTNHVNPPQLREPQQQRKIGHDESLTGLYASVGKKTSDFTRDGVDSGDESFHIESEMEDP